MGETTGLVQPVVALFREFLHRVPGKEVGIDLSGVCLRGNGFGSVLAELKGGAVVLRVGPCATGAIKAARLIEREHGRCASQEAAAGVDVIEGRGNGGDTRSRHFGFSDLDASEGFGRLGVGVDTHWGRGGRVCHPYRILQGCLCFVFL